MLAPLRLLIRCHRMIRRTNLYQIRSDQITRDFKHEHRRRRQTTASIRLVILENRNQFKAVIRIAGIICIPEGCS